MSVSEISAQDYHDDKLGSGAIYLSKSIALEFLTKSPAHARAKHPKLNPDFVRVEEDKFDLGMAAHQLVLEGHAAVMVVDSPDWRSGMAKDARAYARAHGQIPILQKYWDRVEAMADAIWNQAPAWDFSPALFTDGEPERTLTWVEDGVAWKCRLDWLTRDWSACHDLKTTSRSASPEAWSKSMFSIGADLQDVIYRRGMKAVFDKDIPLYFVVVETTEPFAMSVFQMGPAAIALAEKKVDFVAQQWKQCLETGVWPSYPTSVTTVEPTNWAENDFFERVYREKHGDPDAL